MIVHVECVYFVPKLTIHKIIQKYTQHWLMESWTLEILIYQKEKSLFSLKRSTMVRRLETVVVADESLSTIWLSTPVWAVYCIRLSTYCGQATVLGSVPSVGILLY